jgi:hypothetical protein
MHGDRDLLKRMRTRTPHDQQRHPLYHVRAWGVVAGSLILLSVCLYRRMRHPDWTGGQAVAVLWPVYLVGIVSICSGWLFRDANGMLRTPAAPTAKAGPTLIARDIKRVARYAREVGGMRSNPPCRER